MQDQSQRTTVSSRKGRWLAVTAIVVAGALLAMEGAASAQGYYVNGQPASPYWAGIMAAYSLPYGQYWLDANGDWGREGYSQPLGNIYGVPTRHRSLSERGLLF